MRALACVLVTLCLWLPVSTAASAQDVFSAVFEAPATGSIEIGRIDFSDGLRAKSDRLGAEELARLANYLRQDLQTALIHANWHGVASEETVLNVTLIDVVPNRPTLAQIQQMDSVHYSSSQVAGGADIEAVLVNDAGTAIARFRFSWHNPEVDPSGSSGVWTDTLTAFGLFSRSVSESLGSAPMPGRSGS
jgi:hypothetical protein